MSDTEAASAAIPRLSAGHKFRFDAVRQAWVLLGPERLFMPDEHAVEILRLVDGQRSIADIAADLAARFAAPLADIQSDVETMLADLARSGAVRL